HPVGPDAAAVQPKIIAFGGEHDLLHAEDGGMAQVDGSAVGDFHHVDAGRTGVRDHILRAEVGRGDAVGIAALPAVKIVRVFTADQDVVAGATEQAVVACATLDVVVAVAPLHVVVAAVGAEVRGV